MERLLVIEDNVNVSRMLCEVLRDDGYEVDVAYDGMTGLQKFKEGDYQMLLLDLMLPYRSGDEILKEIRTYSDIPVMILSAKDMIHTKIDMLQLGADDYITKPFDLGEVSARVETHLRRYRKCNGKQQTDEDDLIYTYKDLQLSSAMKKATVGENELDLTAKEYQILELLLMNQNKVFSKANLYETLWQEEYLGDDNAIKTHISNLRSKLKKANPEGEYIETVWGLGYRMYRDRDKR